VCVHASRVTILSVSTSGGAWSTHWDAPHRARLDSSQALQSRPTFAASFPRPAHGKGHCLVVGEFVFFSHGVDVEMFAQMGGPALLGACILMVDAF
jgi:hypothetical protein